MRGEALRAAGRAVLLAPFLVFLGLFWVAPLIGGLWMSLHADGVAAPGERAAFVGLDHYRALLDDGRYFKAARNTFLYAAFTLVAVIPAALALAHLLRGAYARARPVLAFALLLPGLTSPAVLALLFLLVFHGDEGLLNQLLVHPFGLETVNWLRDPKFILAALVLQGAWRWTGFMTFFVLSGIDAIPATCVEAARLETNSRWQIFRRVTLPLLRPVLLFCAVYLVVDAFSLFSGAYVLLGPSGGTADAGLLLVSYTYQNAFTFLRFGTGAAISLSVAPFLLLLVWLCFLAPRGRRWAGGAVVARA